MTRLPLLRRARRVTILISTCAFMTMLSAAPARATQHFSWLTLDGGSCTGQAKDPLNVSWVLGGTLTYREVKNEIGGTLHWNYAAGSLQSTRVDGHCNVQTTQIDGEWGTPISNDAGSYPRRYKAHIRLWADGANVAGDAHHEHKDKRCFDPHTGQLKPPTDAVDVTVNKHWSGFDYEERVFRKKLSHSNATLVSAPSPYARAFRQCNGKWVQWNGNRLVIHETGTGSA